MLGSCGAVGQDQLLHSFLGAVIGKVRMSQKMSGVLLQLHKQREGELALTIY